MTVPGGSKTNATGRASGARKQAKHTRIAEQFIAHRVRMLESAAWGALSRAARRILDRLEIEHANHGGKDNGRLVCTYGDFAEFGIRRETIQDAIPEAIALGFIEITERGRAAPEDFGTPNLFRLTYLPTSSSCPTDEWERIESEERARTILADMRGRLSSMREQKERRRKEARARAKKQNPGGEIAPASGAESPLLRQPLGGGIAPTFYISGGRGGGSPPRGQGGGAPRQRKTIWLRSFVRFPTPGDRC
jgi:hypothetical protein